MRNEKIKKELFEIAPKLSEKEKSNPFTVPNRYFETMSERVMEKITPPQPVNWSDKLELFLNHFFNQIFNPRYAIPAAAFLVVIAVGIGFLKTDNRLDLPKNLAAIEKEAMQVYLYENYDDFELMAFNGNAFSDVPVIPEEISTDILIEYLDFNYDNLNQEEELL